jgi:hypothetical protein
LSKQPLAIVCALAFVAGGAAAYVLEYPPRGAAGVRGVADAGADAGRAAAPADSEATEARPDALTRPEEVAPTDDARDSSPRNDDASAGPTQAGGEDEGVANPSTRVRGRAAFDGRGGERRSAARGYARASRGGVASGGRSIAGYAVGGVKKTGGGVKKAGAAIGKTFGKIGGVFHD